MPRVQYVQITQNAGSASLTSHTVTLAAPATAGNLLWAQIGIDKGGLVTAPPAGWTLLVAYANTSVGAALAYKFAAGGETTVTLAWDAAKANSSMLVTEYSGVSGPPVLVSALNTGEASAASLDFAAYAVPGAGLALVSLMADSHYLAAPTMIDGVTLVGSSVSAASALGNNHTGMPECALGAREFTAAGTLDTAATLGGGNSDQLYGALVFFPAAAGGGAALSWAWSGIGGQDSGVVTARTTAPASVRLRVSPQADLSGAQDTPAVLTASPDLTARLAPGGLTPGTLYHYGVVVDGVLGAQRGKFRTAPAGAASFTFAASSCAQTDSTSSVFARIAARTPSFFVMLGDLHYMDIGTNSPALFREAYARSVGVAAQQALYRHVRSAHVWSDHDAFGNNSDGASPARPAGQAAYRAHTPHVPLPHPEGIYHAFVEGRVRVIMTDHRSFASPSADADGPGKTKLGATQKAWFKEQLLAAKGAGQAIVWANAEPWIAGVTTSEDHWGAYATERRELADFFQAEGLLDRLVILSGDAHMLAFDNGTNSNYATVPQGLGPPVYHGASLDQTGSVKGGPYSGGTLAGRHQYALLTVTDTGGETLTLRYDGIRADDTVWGTHTAVLSVPAVQPPPTYLDVEDGQMVLRPFPDLGTPEAAALPTAAWHGLCAWTDDPALATATGGPASGEAQMAYGRAAVGRAAGAVLSLYAEVTAAGAGLTYARCAVYRLSAGTWTQVGLTGDQAGAWTTTGFKTMPLTLSQAIAPADELYLALLAVGTTAPLFRQPVAAGPLALLSGVGSGLKRRAARTGQSALPATLTLGDYASIQSMTWLALT